VRGKEPLKAAMVWADYILDATVQCTSAAGLGPQLPYRLAVAATMERKVLAGKVALMRVVKILHLDGGVVLDAINSYMVARVYIKKQDSVCLNIGSTAIIMYELGVGELAFQRPKHAQVAPRVR